MSCYSNARALSAYKHVPAKHDQGSQDLFPGSSYTLIITRLYILIHSRECVPETISKCFLDTLFSKCVFVTLYFGIFLIGFLKLVLLHSNAFQKHCTNMFCIFAWNVFWIRARNVVRIH